MNRNDFIKNCQNLFALTRFNGSKKMHHASFGRRLRH